MLEQDLAENISELEHPVVVLVLQAHRSGDTSKGSDALVCITPDDVIGRENQAGFFVVSTYVLQQVVVYEVISPCSSCGQLEGDTSVTLCQ